MRKIATVFAFIIAALSVASAKDYKVTSPSGDLKVVVSVSDSTTYSLFVKDVPVMENCRIAMTLSDGRVLGDRARVRKDTRGTRTDAIDAPFYRQRYFETAYNYIRLSYEGDYNLQIRAYNDGICYRFVTSFAEDVEVVDETVEFNFAQGTEMVIPYVRPDKVDRYTSSFESQYTDTTIGGSSDKLAFLPIVVKTMGGGNLLLCESDVEHYPGMFVKESGRGLVAEFPPVPTDYTVSDRGVDRPAVYGNVIARTKGSRSYPWRIVGYAPKDKDLPTNNMVYQTASQCRLDDVNWITPGHSAWDWWNDFVLYGVDFKSGVNTATYKYHVDFAEKNGLEYIILDEGWYKNLDPMTLADDVDVKEICDYAQQAGVKVILWITTTLLHKNLEPLCDHYSKMGVAGFKVDFFDAQDQHTVETVYDIAEVAARYHLVLDLHGMYKPTGLNRTFPNILNFEGVFGLENLKWSSLAEADMPRNQVMIPYLRMASGPMDYTQGAMRNAGKNEYQKSYSRPMSQGTRAAQVAAYVVYDSPLVMLCDSPSDYLGDKETLDYIVSIPTVFDSTEIVEGTIGEYIVSRRSGDGKWYIGAMTNWTGRNVTVDFSFLPAGDWTAKIYKDGVNVDKVASDYMIKTLTVNSDTRMELTMASGGGFAIILEN